MSCNCSEFSGKLTLINSKIDALLKENTALKTKLKKKADFSQLNRVESNINSRNNPFFEKVDNGLDILGQRIKDLVIKDNQELEKQFKREAAYATKSDIARLERRLSSVEAFIRESEKDKESGLFATKAELEKLRREAATKDYVDQKDNALKRSLEKLIDNAEDDISGLQRELSAEVRERKRLINQIKSTAESAKTTAEKALKEARKKKEAVDNFARTQIAKLEAKVSALALKVATNTAKIAGLAAAVALIKKTLAGVSLVLAKLTPLLALVGTIVSVFGTGFSIASFYQTSNRINKLEAEVLSLGNEISRILGKFITPLVARVRRLENQDNVTSQELSRGLASLGASLNSRLNRISGVANIAQVKANAAELKTLALQTIVGTTATIFTSRVINIITNRYPNIGRNTVTREVITNNNTRIIERQPIIQPQKTIVRETRTVNNNTNTITNNTVREVIRDIPDNKVDYSRIKTIANNAVKPTEKAVTSTQREVRNNGRKLSGIQGSIAAVQANVSAQAAQTRGWIQTQLQPVVNITNDIKKKADSLYNNQFTQTAINLLNTIFHVHMAARVSVDAAQFVGDVVDQVIGNFGINFSDENGADITLNQVIGNKLNGVVDAIIPDVTQEGIRDAWLRSNTIFRSASNIYWSVESLGDITRSVTEITNDRLGLWMNTARNEGLVSPNAYPHQPPISTSSRYGRTNAFLAKVNRGVDGWDNTVNQIEDSASTVSYVASVPIEVGEEISQIQQERAAIANATTVSQTTVATAEASQLLDNEAPETLVSPTQFLETDL